MRTIDHAVFSVRFSDSVLKIKNPAKKFSFIIGNLIPDFSYHTYKKSIGHGFKTARKKLVLAWQSRHSGGENCAFYFRLGVAAHYLCDAFTYPHNKSFPGTFADHLRYEDRLHRYFTSDVSGIFSAESDDPVFNTPEACMRFLEHMHKNYIGRKKKTPFSDFCDIAAVCRTALLSSLSIPKNYAINARKILTL